MYSEKITKQQKSLEERGIPNHSYFILTFQDDSVISEMDCNWSDISSTKIVSYFGGKKTVAICDHSVKSIILKHEEMEHNLEIPEGCEVYQAIRAETNFLNNGQKKERINGRVLGIVCEGEVIEEYFLNGVEGRIMGMKK